MPNWMQKQKSSKQNGESGRYKTVNHNTWNKFSEDLFKEMSWCYLHIIFVNNDYRINTILWKDELDLLKKMISFPFKYRTYTYSKDSAKFCLEILLETIPESMKQVYEQLDQSGFCEYYKKGIKGY